MVFQFMNLSTNSRTISLLVTFILKVLKLLSKSFKSLGRIPSINTPNVLGTNLRMGIFLSFGKSRALG